MTKEEKTLHRQSLKTETLKMAMSILDSKIQRQLENQSLLPQGRQSPVNSYSAEDVITSAKQLLDYICED